MIYRRSIYVTKLRSVFFTLYNRFENNNNADYYTNGEKHFINDYFSSLSGSVTLLDIGGNIGEYSDILLQQCTIRNLKYSLHIFEPTQSCFGVLKNKYSFNSNVYLNNVGVSDSRGRADIYYDNEESGYASLYKRDYDTVHIRMDKKEEINLIRLDEYLAQQKINNIDLMKIDIEGHEISAFRGMGKYLNGDTVKMIQFEYGGVNLDSKTTLREIYSILEDSGFVLGKIMKKCIDIRPYNLQLENYQYANYVAISRKLIPSIE